MNKLEKNERFSSCRGVSFEIKVFPGSSVYIERSLSRPSSHFCDLNLDHIDENNDECMEEIHDVEKQKPIILTTNKDEQPRKASRERKSRLSIILLDQGLFTVYKQLFVVCITLNLFALVLATTGHFVYAKNRGTLFSIWNIFALTLGRSEAVLRVVFWLAVKAFGRPWIPLKIKTATTSLLQSLGGIHSGCGVASIMWLVYSLVLALKDKENTSHVIIGVAFAILSLVCLSSLAAFPLVRHLHHNVFERTHRFAGWSALFLLWIFILLTIAYDPSSKSYRSLTCTNLIKYQEFWFTFAINLLIILPWMTVRRVPVTVSAPSGHASIIKFDGGVKAGLLGRISPSPLSEWHAFGIISYGKKDHMMLAGAVGDFTRSLVSNPPSHLWVRQVHFAGLPYLVNMYERVLLVATGSGICVFLSFLLQPCSTDVIVHDTAVLGRPKVSNMTVEAAKRWNAEVVIVTSNPEGSRDVVDACKAAKIPAFGPIWDS
ncbi:hypothetical protein AQUCO_05500057v1 [Aquilegia coerulea]|uniref:Uncharacterized protein n=1 Tax=Aquilegia coerulea TaxID=218851 RepID=A0A2G5CGS1_AQUCA|nr:hypothetical protein AQUCO_05500057v1 [Aquilegia coerulea]